MVARPMITYVSRSAFSSELRRLALFLPRAERAAQLQARPRLRLAPLRLSPAERVVQPLERARLLPPPLLRPQPGPRLQPRWSARLPRSLVRLQLAVGPPSPALRPPWCRA